MGDGAEERRMRHSPGKEAALAVSVLVGCWVVGFMAFAIAYSIAAMADYPEGPMVLVNWASLALAHLLGFPFLHLMGIPGVGDWAYNRFGSLTYHVTYGLSAFSWASLVVSVRRSRRRRRGKGPAPTTSGP